MQEKKKWQNPELIVLVRGKPEEAVLTACKGGMSAGWGTTDTDCSYTDQPAGGCAPGVCEVTAIS